MAQGFVTLKYRSRASGETDWQDQSYPVYLDTTPCHLGGERQWFFCPARGCGRRVAMLYGGGVYACRHCHRLAYPSQREAPHDRVIRKADRIRDKLGWEPGTANGHGMKPKGMHRRTFERLCADQRLFASRLECVPGAVWQASLTLHHVIQDYLEGRTHDSPKKPLSGAFLMQSSVKAIEGGTSPVCFPVWARFCVNMPC